MSTQSRESEILKKLSGREDIGGKGNESATSS